MIYKVHILYDDTCAGIPVAFRNVSLLLPREAARL